MVLKKVTFYTLVCIFLQTYVYPVDFVLMTQPKTGTHLLVSILESLTGKKSYWPGEEQKNVEPVQADYEAALKDPKYIYFSTDLTPWKKETMDHVWEINEQQGSFLHLHPPYSVTMEKYLVEKKCVNFFVKRDPRDQIISLLNHYKHIKFIDQSIASIPSDDQRLLRMIETTVKASTLSYMGWLKSPACCVLDFAKLMGAHGEAATDADALGELRKIATALQLNVSDDYLRSLYKEHFGKSQGFFRGKVGVWKDYFNRHHKKATKKAIGDLLIELGYEKDCNW